MISVAIVDSKRDIRDGVRALLDATEGFCCTDTYADVHTALQGMLSNPPAVALVDVELPGQSGLDFISRLTRQLPKLNLIIYTDTTEDEAVFQALQSGAIGYILNNSFPSVLLRAIREAAHGGAPLSPSISRRVVQVFNRQAGTVSDLSEREYEVLALLCEGHSYREIGEKLFVSSNTVRFHLKNIYRKLQVKSRHEAVAKAMRLGLLVLS
jgi:DNA-binding NarL/FixJ family response regulator